ncbi:MAG: hypothetical protein FK733_04405 [Asgard group archaeon]|nr:hypothetical protein [Asgard group archaeon]
MGFKRFFRLLPIFLCSSFLISNQIISLTVVSPLAKVSSSSIRSFSYPFVKRGFSDYSLTSDHPNITSVHNNHSILFSYNDSEVSTWSSEIYSSSADFHDFYLCFLLDYQLSSYGSLSLHMYGSIYDCVLGVRCYNISPPKTVCFVYSYINGSLLRYESEIIQNSLEIVFLVERNGTNLSINFLNINGATLFKHDWFGINFGKINNLKIAARVNSNTEDIFCTCSNYFVLFSNDSNPTPSLSPTVSTSNSVGFGSAIIVVGSFITIFFVYIISRKINKRKY